MVESGSGGSPPRPRRAREGRRWVWWPRAHVPERQRLTDDRGGVAKAGSAIAAENTTAARARGASQGRGSERIGGDCADRRGGCQGDGSPTPRGPGATIQAEIENFRLIPVVTRRVRSTSRGGFRGRFFGFSADWPGVLRLQNALPRASSGRVRRRSRATHEGHEYMDRAQLLDMFRTKASEVAEKDLSWLDESSVIASLGLDSPSRSRSPTTASSVSSASVTSSTSSRSRSRAERLQRGARRIGWQP